MGAGVLDHGGWVLGGLRGEGGGEEGGEYEMFGIGHVVHLKNFPSLDFLCSSAI